MRAVYAHGAAARLHDVRGERSNVPQIVRTHISCLSAYMIITKELLDKVSSEAKSSARLRMRSTFGRFACQRTTTYTSH